MRTAGARRADEVDLVILELVRLTCAETWTVDSAAVRLRSKRHSAGALRMAMRRVSRARAERGTPIADRAAATLSAVIAGLDVDRQPATVSD